MSDRILGSLRRLDDGRGAVRMEDVYGTDIADLWSALTDVARLAHWVAAVEGDLRAGGRIRARFTSEWEGTGRIDACDPPGHLVVTWEPGTPNETVGEAVLTPMGDGTGLVVEERGIPLDELAAHGAGWQTHLEDLRAHLSGRRASVWQARWREIQPAYRRLADGLR
jgi:uncharacterized protein YndB with AHSA1/START domain